MSVATGCWRCVHLIAAPRSPGSLLPLHQPTTRDHRTPCQPLHVPPLRPAPFPDPSHPHSPPLPHSTGDWLPTLCFKAASPSLTSRRESRPSSQCNGRFQHKYLAFQPLTIRSSRPVGGRVYQIRRLCKWDYYFF